jgi:hypothetical protein
MSRSDRRHFGRILFGPPQPADFDPRGKADPSNRMTRQPGTWYPTQRLSSRFPPGFSVPVNCYTGPDGLRRFVKGLVGDLSDPARACGGP